MKLKKKKGKEKLTIRWKYRKIGMHNFLNFSKILATLFVSAIHVLNRSRSRLLNLRFNPLQKVTEIPRGEIFLSKYQI